MIKYRRFVVFALVLLCAMAAAILFTGLFTSFADPQFQRALLRLLAVLGFAAILTMCVSLLSRVEPQVALIEPRRAVRRRKRA